MIRNKLNHSAITCAVMAIAAFAGTANAAVATSTVPVTMAVTAPTCSVVSGTNNATIALPQAAGPGTTVQSYLTANSITIAAVSAGGWMTSASALNQAATVTCNAANTTILSILVQPATSAVTISGSPAYLLLADATSPTPAVAGGINTVAGFQFSAELVSVNGTAAPFAFYKGGASLTYSTSFNTGPLSGSSSTATFIWRPVTLAGTPTALIGNPTGGIFAGSYQVVVNY